MVTVARTGQIGRPKISADVRESFWERWSAGMPTVEAAAAAHVSKRAASRWVTECGGVRPRRPVKSKGRYLSLEEREEIAVGRAANKSFALIARELGRSTSTVTREVKRNAAYGRRGRYRAVNAHTQAQQRARRPKAAKLLTNKKLRQVVQRKLDLKWSPEQISNWLIQRYPKRPEMRVSHETIYQSLYVQSRGALRRELTECLRTGRAVRRPKRRADERRGRIPNMINISERPAEVEDRHVPGHWEGDLIIGKDGKSAIGTLVERSTRFVMLLHLTDGNRAEQVEREMLRAIAKMPKELRGSLTWDQGTEMRRHAQITIASGLEIYFCDPHSPWQRGSNENTNGLLRQYFPKATDLSVHSRAHLEKVARELNGRPRKTLGWKNPLEALNELLVASAA